MTEINEYVADDEYLETCSKKELKELVITFHKSLCKTDDILREAIIDKQFYRRQLSDNWKEHKRKESALIAQIEELKKNHKIKMN